MALKTDLEVKYVSGTGRLREERKDVLVPGLWKLSVRAMQSLEILTISCIVRGPVIVKLFVTSHD